MNAANPGPSLQGPPGSTETLSGFSQWHEIGRGGDATVYRAIQDGLQREVAIKVLMVDDPESIRRFTREVQLMVALGRQHPNIAKVLQIGTSSLGRPCIVMDYYELGSLDRRLGDEGPLPAADVAHVGNVVADALAFAHQKGVLHRDIKPQNILMMPTSYVLADFGIARLIDQAHTASSDRFSYRHASPQVLNGDTPSELDDIFSLGATLYHLLDGQPPFTLPGQRDSALSYIKRVIELPPRALTRPDIPDSLRQVVDIALRKDPATRFQSAAEMRDALADSVRHARSAPAIPQGTGAWSAASATSPGAPPPAPLPPTMGPAQTSPAQLPRQVSGPDQTPASLPSAPHHTGARRTPARRAAEEDDAPPRPPWLAFGLTGIVVGVVLVLLLSFLGNRHGEPTPQPTPTGGSTVVAQPDDALTPANLEVTYYPEGDYVIARWDKPEELPVGYTLAFLVDDTVAGEGVSRFGSSTDGQLNHPPEGSQICVGLTSFSSDARYGRATACTNRSAN